jgi:hypothetical protein
LYRHSAHRWWSGCQCYVPAVVYSTDTFCGTYFCSSLSQPPGHSVAGRIRSIERNKIKYWRGYQN